MPSDLTPEQRAKAIETIRIAYWHRPAFTEKGKDRCERILDDLIFAGWRPEPQPADTATCCMCGKVVDTREIGDAPDVSPDGCEMYDGRWACSSKCYDRAMAAKFDAIAAAEARGVEAAAKVVEEYNIATAPLTGGILAKAIRALSALEPAQPDAIAADGLVPCECCGHRVKVDAIVDNDVFAKISPTGDENGYFCANCMVERLSDLPGWGTVYMTPAHGFDAIAAAYARGRREGVEAAAKYHEGIAAYYNPDHGGYASDRARHLRHAALIRALSSIPQEADPT